MALERLESVLDYLQKQNEKKADDGRTGQDLEDVLSKLGIKRKEMLKSSGKNRLEE